MILIITHKEDFTADYVVNKLNKRNIPYTRLNCEDILKSDYSINIEQSINMSLLNNLTYKSTWYRRTKLPNIDLPTNEKLYVLNEIDSFFENIFSILDTNWLSIPYHVRNAENKLLQLKAALDVGFKIPKTLISNSKDEIIAFYRENSNELIVKPISHTKIKAHDNSKFIFTNEITEEHVNSIFQYDLTPCIFQQKIKKEYEIRVTVVDDNVFSAFVDSQKHEETKVDWRKKKLQFKPISLPKKIQKLCTEILQKLNIRFGAIDIIKDIHGEYIFLEINPNGQWAWIEEQTMLPISDAIINALSHEYTK